MGLVKKIALSIVAVVYAVVSCTVLAIVNNFTAKKIAQTYPLEERLLRRLLRIQVQRLQPTPLYDLDYDIQLNTAIDIIQNGQWSSLMKKAS